FLMGFLAALIGVFRPYDALYPPPTWTIYSVLMWVPTILTLAALASAIALPPAIFVARYVRALGPFDLRRGERWSLPKWSTIRQRIPTWNGLRLSKSPALALFWKATRETGFIGLLVFLVSLLLSMFAANLGLVDRGPTTPFFAATSESLRPFLW